MPPPPISVKSPIMKSFGMLPKASKFDYSKASPTKNATFDVAEDVDWVDEEVEVFAGGIGQGEASALIGEYELSVNEERAILTDGDGEDEIEGVKKLKKKTKGKRKEQVDNSGALGDFKFPATGAASTTASSAAVNSPPNASSNVSANHQKWRPSMTTAAVIEEDEEDD